MIIRNHCHMKRIQQEAVLCSVSFGNCSDHTAPPILQEIVQRCIFAKNIFKKVASSEHANKVPESGAPDSNLEQDEIV
jgi:hypothetical protein